MSEATILVPWRQVWLHPRAAMREAISRPTLGLLLAPIASGIVQSLVQGASSRLGQRGASPGWILLMGSLVGSLWGLIQWHFITGLFYLFARDQAGKKVPFRTLRSAVALSYAPLGGALVAWVAGTLVLGRGLYADPEAIAAAYGPFAALQVSALYFMTMACILWSLVLQVLGVAEARGSSVSSALGTVVLSLLSALLAITVVVIAAVTVFS